MWAVSVFIIIIVMVATRVRVMQQVEHYLYEFVQNQFMENLKPKNPFWFSFITTLFVFILFCNLAGLVPGSNSPTSDISVTVALALMIFFISILMGIIAHGFGFLKQFVPENVPIFLLPFMVVLEFFTCRSSLCQYVRGAYDFDNILRFCYCFKSVSEVNPLDRSDYNYFI